MALALGIAISEFQCHQLLEQFSIDKTVIEIGFRKFSLSSIDLKADWCMFCEGFVAFYKTDSSLIIGIFNNKSLRN